MTYTVLGVLADELGHAHDPDQPGATWPGPADEYRDLQPDRIPIDLDHNGRPVGQVIHLERHRGNLWCVGEVDGAQPAVAVRVGDDVVHVEDDLFWSAQRLGDVNGQNILLRSVAITWAPARVTAHSQPLLWFEGNLGDRGSWLLDKRRITGHLADLIERAAEARHDRCHHREGLPIYDVAEPPALARSSGASAGSEPTLAPLARPPQVYDPDTGIGLGPTWHGTGGRVLRTG